MGRLGALLVEIDEAPFELEVVLSGPKRLRTVRTLASRTVTDSVVLTLVEKKVSTHLQYFRSRISPMLMSLNAGRSVDCALTVRRPKLIV